MVQEIVHWCDRCMFDEPARRTPGSSETITIGAQTYEADLCKECRDEVVAPLEALLHKASRRAERDSVAALTCPVCDKQLHALTTAKHMRPVHDLTMEQVYGTRCPLCGASFDGTTALGVHARSAHDESGVAGVFETAISQGIDPHGVVAVLHATVARYRGKLPRAGGPVASS